MASRRRWIQRLTAGRRTIRRLRGQVLRLQFSRAAVAAETSRLNSAVLDQLAVNATLNQANLSLETAVADLKALGRRQIALRLEAEHQLRESAARAAELEEQLAGKSKAYELLRRRSNDLAEDCRVSNARRFAAESLLGSKLEYHLSAEAFNMILNKHPPTAMP